MTWHCSGVYAQDQRFFLSGHLQCGYCCSRPYQLIHCSQVPTSHIPKMDHQAKDADGHFYQGRVTAEPTNTFILPLAPIHSFECLNYSQNHSLRIQTFDDMGVLHGTPHPQVGRSPLVSFPSSSSSSTESSALGTSCLYTQSVSLLIISIESLLRLQPSFL